MLLHVALVFFLVTSAKAYNEDLVTEFECLNYTIYPTQYDITITPYIKRSEISYNCILSITVIANEPHIQHIILNSNNLKILRVIVASEDGRIKLSENKFSVDEDKKKLHIYLDRPMMVYRETHVQYNIDIYFEKTLTADSEGIFFVPYEDGGSKYMIGTRLSPDKAMNFFPCFEDQRFESVFKFRVYHPSPNDELQEANTSLFISKALSNEYSSTNNGNNYIIKEFVPSPQVPLHQVGFHFSQFRSRQISTGKDTIAIWAPTKDLTKYNYVLNFSKKMLQLILEFSSNELPLVNGPINIVAVPKNLDGYEIESWNLLTNGENRLAHVYTYTSIRQLELMKYELTLQLSRIWLGNPGELRRTHWKQQWFKEGVATYLAHYFLTQLQNDVNSQQHRIPIDIYGLQMKYKAMAKDWYNSVALTDFNDRLIVNIEPSDTELIQMKTASLLWMVENWIGSDKFHKALVGYIKSRRGQYLTLEDFLGYVDKETIECKFFNGSTAIKILDSWFSKSGYPVIYVNVLRDRSPDAIQLKQHKFSFYPASDDTNYMIPISYIVQNNKNCYNCHRPRFTMENNAYTFREALDGGWIILNTNATGYYRVNYDQHTWKLIAKALREDHHSIPEQNRAQIVNDAFALYASGEVDHELAVEILNYLDKETSPVVWEAAISGFELLKTPDAQCHMTKYLYQDWQEFMRSRVDNVYKQVTELLGRNPAVRKEEHIRKFYRNIVGFACAVHNEECIRKMEDFYENPSRRRSELDSDIRETCYEVHYRKTKFIGHHFNSFEVEDKMMAEQRVREEEMFVSGLPMGTPVIGRLVVSSTPEPPPVSSVRTPESQQPAPTTTPGGASAIMASALVLAISSLLLSVVK